ncbi:hypothetical protein [Paenibacillus senegalensis]|uniref:hypothetical protein n=1 Tax=Paenibacillus senegalensis TaxID=1465766 RepID=UPI000289281D|nr:hypothetical protein [Paenibacillus senegalensis]
MGFPTWFRGAIQRRLDEVSAQIEYHPELKKIRDEEDEAFHAVFAGLIITQTPEFEDWEDKYILKQSMMNERLYMQGLTDGIQLASALLNHSDSTPHETPVTFSHEKGQAKTKS